MQVVVLAGTSGSRFFPVTETIPKALLPVGNRKLITYLLASLCRCGARRIVIATTARFAEAMRAAVKADADLGYGDVEVKVVDEMSGSYGALRDVATGSVLCVSGECALGSRAVSRLVEAHSLRCPDCTMLLSKTDKDDEIFAMKDHRVLMKTTVVELEERRGVLRLPKGLLRRAPQLVVTRDLTDVHAYVLEMKSLSFDASASLRGEVVPELAQRYAKEMIPADEDHDLEASELYAKLMADSDTLAPRGAFAVIAEDQEEEDDDPVGADFARRVRSVASYAALCRRVVARASNSSLKPRGKLNKRDGSLVGESSTLGDKAQVKHTTIGMRCVVGVKVKINNSVIFDDVTIHDGAVVQKSIVCSGAVIGHNANLNDVQVGPGAIVPPNAILKQEAVTNDDEPEEHSSDDDQEVTGLVT